MGMKGSKGGKGGAMMPPQPGHPGQQHPGQFQNPNAGYYPGQPQQPQQPGYYPGQQPQQPGYYPGQQPGQFQDPNAGYYPGHPGQQPAYPGQLPPGQQYPQPPQNNFNFSQYNLSPQEVQALQSEFAAVAGRDGRIDRREFMNLYSQLNPAANGPYLQAYSERAFRACDTNGDGFISYDEFVAAYIVIKTQPHNFPQTATNLLNQFASQPGYLSQDEALHYTNWAHNYFGQPTGVPPPQQIVGRFAGQPQIPIQEFVEYTVPLYTPYL